MLYVCVCLRARVCVRVPMRVCGWCVEFKGHACMCFRCVGVSTVTRVSTISPCITIRFTLCSNWVIELISMWLWSCWVKSYYKVTGQLVWIMNKVVCWCCITNKVLCVAGALQKMFVDYIEKQIKEAFARTAPCLVVPPPVVMKNTYTHTTRFSPSWENT